MAAPGPSLTSEVAEQVRETGWPVIACQDAFRLMPWADILYGCDERWWDAYDHSGFTGEKWSCHGDARNNDKRACAEKHEQEPRHYGDFVVNGHLAFHYV